jgi:hypothetical protein
MFRRHVRQCSSDHSLSARSIVYLFGQIEVDQKRTANRVQKDVCRFHVTMKNVVAASEIQTTCDFCCDKTDCLLVIHLFQPTTNGIVFGVQFGCGPRMLIQTEQ